MQFDHWYVRLHKASILFFFPLKYQCCGIIDKNDYDESKWKEQALGGADLNYPLTCCVLDNAKDLQSYLNPMPRDKDKCMSSDIRVHRSERYQPVSIRSYQTFELSATNFFFIFRDVFNTFWNGQCWNLSLSLQSVAGVQSLKSWALSCPYTSSRTSGSGTKMCKVDNGRWPLTPIAAIIPIGTILICNIDLMGMTHLYAFRRKKIYDALISLWLHFVDICFAKTFRLSELFECIKDLLLLVEFLLL